MKKIVIFLFLVILSVCIYAQESVFPKEIRTNKVKISEKMTTVGTLLGTLSKDSDIKFLTGETYDWRVAERDIIIVPSEKISLGSLLDSVAFCTKLVWVKKDNNTFILTYNENTDTFIKTLNDKAEENIAKKRKDAVDRFFNENTNEDLDKLKEDDPINYLLDVTGLKTTTSGLINNIPGMKEALTNGTSMTINGSNLSDKAVNYIYTSMDIINNLTEDRIQRISNGREKRREKENLKKLNEFLEKNKSKVSVEVNNNNPMSNLMLGSAVIKVDGRSVGFIPLVDSKNPIAKKIGSAMVTMYENPNMNPKEAFESVGGFDVFRDINSSLNKDIYDENKINIPDGIVFDEEITLEDTPKSKLNAFELLSKASGYSVVSDNFVNFFDLFAGNNIRKTGTLKEIVSDINEAYGLTMYMENNVMMFYSVKWFEEIQKLMPKVYLEKWGKQYSEEGFISRENLFEMAKFSKDQLSYGFMKNSSLTKLSSSVLPNYNLIKFISNLDNESLKDLESESGLNIGLLVEKYYKELLKVEKFRFLSENKEGVLKLITKKDENSEILTVIAQNKEHKETVDIKLEKYSAFVFNSGDIFKNKEK